MGEKRKKRGNVGGGHKGKRERGRGVGSGGQRSVGTEEGRTSY